MAELNFAALFSGTAGDGGWQLTPRTAYVLHTALCLLADGAYNDIETYEAAPVTDSPDWEVFGRLPRLTWKTDLDWRRQFARAADDLVEDLEAGRWPNPRNNAEEAMLHMAIVDAPDLLSDEIDGTDSHDVLPEFPSDYDWDRCAELLFEDDDISMLFDPSLDGFEDPDADVNREYGIGDLRPDRWFDPFRDDEARDPQRGYRR